MLSYLDLIFGEYYILKMRGKNCEMFVFIRELAALFFATYCSTDKRLI